MVVLVVLVVLVVVVVVVVVLVVLVCSRDYLEERLGDYSRDYETIQ